MYMYCFNRLMWCSIDCLIETCAWPSDDTLYISFVYHSHGWPQWDSNPLALFCHFSPPSLIISLPVLIFLATLILTHQGDCFHLSLINIPFLVYLVSVVRSLYVSVPAIPSDIYGSCFSESGPCHCVLPAGLLAWSPTDVMCTDLSACKAHSFHPDFSLPSRAMSPSSPVAHPAVTHALLSCRITLTSTQVLFYNFTFTDRIST